MLENIIHYLVNTSAKQKERKKRQKIKAKKNIKRLKKINIAQNISVNTKIYNIYF